MYTEYKILKHEVPGKLAKQVNEAMEKGYQPIGGVAIGTITDKTNTKVPYFLQAVAK